MGFIDNLRSRFISNKSESNINLSESQMRSLEALFVENHFNGLQEPDFLDYLQSDTISGTINSEQLGLYDITVSPHDIYDMTYRDTYFSPLLEQMVSALFENGWSIQPLKGSRKSKAKELNEKLEEINYIDIIEKIVYGLWGDGGGNVLLFTTKESAKRGLNLRIEPFMRDGHTRVKVYGRDDLFQITKYDVLSIDRSPIFTIDPNTQFYAHLRYSNAGNYRFSTNPAKRAVYWYVLKKRIAGANLYTFKEGLQDPTLMSPDYSALKDLKEAMSGHRLSGDTDQILKDPLKYFKAVSEMDDQLLREISGNVRKTNSTIKFKMPYKFEKLNRSNKDLETIPLIAVCDEQMGYPLKTSKGLLNTKDAKYNNAEMERDNWMSLVLNPAKTDIEILTKKYILPIIDPTINLNEFEVIFGRDPDEEDLKVFQAKTEKQMKQATIITQLESSSEYYYDIEDEEIKKREESDIEEQPETELEENIEDQAEDMEENIEDQAEDMEENIDDQAENNKSKKEVKKKDQRGLLRSIDDNGFVMIGVENKYTNKFNKLINSDDIVKQDYDVESYPHLTIGSMLDKSVSIENVQKIVDKYVDKIQDIEIISDEIDYFESKDYDVLKFNIKSNEILNSLNQELQLLPNNSEFDFNPHITINYIKPGYGDNYINKLELSEPIKFKIKDITFSQGGETKRQMLYENNQREHNHDHKRAKQSIVSKTLKSSDAKKFESSIEKAIKRQLEDFIKQVENGKDSDTEKIIMSKFKPITNFGLTVNSYKQQLLKFGQIAVNEFIRDTGETKFRQTRQVVNGFDYPSDILQLLDARAVMMIKGIQDLPKLQQQQILEIFGQSFKAYAGFDTETSTEIATIVKNNLEKGLGRTGIINDLKSLIPTISKHRANLIASTDIAQSVEGSKFQMYKSEEFDQKMWDSVDDNLVRKSHSANESEGWVDINYEYPTTQSMSPAEEYQCRCSLRFKRSKVE